MPKSKRDPRNTPRTEVIQKLYARAYASRLAKQVADELDSSRRKTTPRKKPAPAQGA